MFSLHFLKVDALVNPLRNSVRSVGNIVRSMPDNFVDGVAKVSGGIRSIPFTMLDGMGKVLNSKGVRIRSTNIFMLNGYTNICQEIIK